MTTEQIGTKLVQTDESGTAVGKPWYVLPDPQWENRHPLHKCRYIATKPEWDYVYDGDPDEEWSFGFSDSDGTVICKLTDLQDQAKVARLIAAAPEMLICLNIIQERLRDMAFPGCSELEAYVARTIDSAKGT